MIEAVYVVLDLRGLSQPFGKRCHVPQGETELGPFLRSTTISLVWQFLALDTIKTICRILGPIGTPEGGSIFWPDLDAPLRYIVSTILTCCTGSAVFLYLGSLHHLLSIFAVLVLGEEPISWPPLFDHPWDFYSVTDFWANRWHQIFRRCFILFGYNPGRWLAGKPGGVLGTFLLSGIMHEIGVRCMGKGPDTVRTVGYFLLQAFGIIVEGVFQLATGKRVGGFAGRLWGFACVVGGANLIVDVWTTRGMTGSSLYPDVISPTDYLLKWGQSKGWIATVQ